MMLTEADGCPKAVTSCYQSQLIGCPTPVRESHARPACLIQPLSFPPLLAMSSRRLSPALVPVQSLVVTFLVDNTIEWCVHIAPRSVLIPCELPCTLHRFGKLPPGFTREMRQHLDQHPPPDPDTGVPVLDLERFCCGTSSILDLCLHALVLTHTRAIPVTRPRCPRLLRINRNYCPSPPATPPCDTARASPQETRASADTPSHLTLFDTGPDSQSLVRNLAALQIRTPSISRVILSHWHADHTGGLLSFLAHRAAHPELAASTPTCVVDAHPSRPRARGIAPPPGDEVLCRLPADPSFAEMADAGARVEMHDEGHAVAGGTVWVSGEIARVTEFEGGLLGGVRFGDSGEWAPEAVSELGGTLARTRTASCQRDLRRCQPLAFAVWDRVVPFGRPLIVIP